MLQSLSAPTMPPSPPMIGRLFLLAFLLRCLAAPISAVDSKPPNISDAAVEIWQVLTKQNFSSQIRLHPHILLLVTLPWSGEARSLMRHVAEIVALRAADFGSLKLMVLHRNKDYTVAKAIGAVSDSDEIAVMYYHHSVPYKYGRRRLRAASILASIRPYVAAGPELLPFEWLRSEEEMRAFVESSDRAVVLFEFCEWSEGLLGKRKKMNGTDHYGFGEFFGNVETNRTEWWKENQKGMETSKMKCDVGNAVGAVPWIADFGSVNDSVPIEEAENIRSHVGSLCTLEEHRVFVSFFAKFMTVAREFFLPPEKHKFGLVSDRSMLSALGVGDSSSWLAVVYFAGFPSCSKIIKNESDLNNALQLDSSFVKELEADGNAMEPTLPANQPSVLLFVDRSSDSLETIIEGKEALNAFRELALQYHMSKQVDSQSRDKLEKSSVRALTTTSGHPKLKISQTTRKKDKMSTFTIINEGKQFTVEKIALDVKGNSLQDILEIVLKQKKKAKLSSLVKELGFQLLSDDMDIKAESALSLQMEKETNPVTEEPSKEGLAASSTESDIDQLPDATSISTEPHPETSSQDIEVNTKYVDASNQILSVESETDYKHDTGEHLNIEEKSCTQCEKSGEQQLGFLGFKGSFFFSDGNFRLLQALTGRPNIPALVIFDPNMQQHYVFPEETNLNYFSLVDFISAFLNGSLLPYQKSETVLQNSRKATPPPFVNLDFHQVDSIPRVTTHTFSELVVGSNESDSDVWNKDVMVLFSNRWCGFCQRMELVLHEVYRAIKGYAKKRLSESKYEKSTIHDDMTGDLKNEMLKLPLIYSLDCTLNDCSLIMKSINQREVYPTLVLFPAKKKHAFPYEGDMAVTEVFKFMADCGSNSHHLISEKGILWTVAKQRGRSQDSFPVQSADIHDQSKDTIHEGILTNLHKPVVEDKPVKSHMARGLHEAPAKVVVGSILVATDQLLSVHPFRKSVILIVKANQDTGFQGLITNRHIRWDALPELGEGLEMLAEAHLSIGGPLINREMPLVALTQRFVKGEYPELLPGIAFLDQSATIQKIKELKSGNQSVTDYWFFLGYSSWGWDQLFDEIANGAWKLSDDGMRLIDWPSS